MKNFRNHFYKLLCILIIAPILSNCQKSETKKESEATKPVTFGLKSEKATNEQVGLACKLNLKMEDGFEDSGSTIEKLETILDSADTNINIDTTTGKWWASGTVNEKTSGKDFWIFFNGDIRNISQVDENVYVLRKSNERQDGATKITLSDMLISRRTGEFSFTTKYRTPDADNPNIVTFKYAYTSGKCMKSNFVPIDNPKL